MSDFTLMPSRRQFQATVHKVWQDHSPGPMKGFIHAPNEMPCAASIFVANGAISCVILDKKSAKRLIYPKTNKWRISIRRFDWVDGNLDEEIEKYIDRSLKIREKTREEPAQIARINELMHKIEGKKGPMLITNRTYSTGNATAVDFFLVTKKLASALVYYNKNSDKDMPDIIPNDEAPQDPLPFFISINREGDISIAPLSIFKTQTDIPRFSDAIEAIIVSWEIAYIKHINTVLKFSQANVEDTISSAKAKCREFLAERKKHRISYASKRRDTWINKNETSLRIRVVIQQATVQQEI